MVVSLATFMEVLDTTITNVSIRNIAGSLGAGQDESTWVLTSYLVANGIILPLSGWLSDMIGRKRFFISCIIGFTVASFFCGTATSLMGLILFRIIQGAAGGGLQPTQQAIILDYFPPEKRGSVFAITGITMIAAPILGPTLGGIITDHFSWRWIFYINVPVGMIAAFLVWKMVENDVPRAETQGTPRIDYIGLGLVSLGLAAMQLVLDKGQQDDWFSSPFIAIWTLVSVLSLVIAIVWLWGQKNPIIDLSLFKNRAFAFSCLLIFLVGFVLFGGSTLLPLMLQSQFGYTATLAGMILSPGGLAVIFLMPISGKLIGRMQARYMIFFGLGLAALGMFHTMQFTPQTDFNGFMWMRITQVIGLPFLFIPISTLAFSDIPKDKSNKASALFALFRNVGGSVGIAVALTYATRHQQIHQHFLAEHLVPGNMAYEYYLSIIRTHTHSLQEAMRNINHTLEVQATLLGFADTFALFGMLLVGALMIAILFLPGNRPGAKATAAAH